MDARAPTSPYGHLHSQARKVIFNVNRYFLEEKANGAPILPPSHALTRTAMATKTSERTVRRICSAHNQMLNTEAEPDTPTFRSPKKKHRAAPVTDFDDFDKRLLRRTVLAFYERKEIPTIYKIKEELREQIGYSGCENSLRKVLLKIGFKFAKVDGRKFLMERNDVLAARTKFLREMRQLKQSDHTFVYLDETWVNQNCTVGKCCTDTSSKEATGVKPPTGKGARLIILHAGTKHGFINNAELFFQAKNDCDYHNQMNSTVFEEWFRMQLLPNIPPNSVIVMDNASYHSRQVEKLPTSSWRKADIKNWLKLKGITVSDDLSKAELYELAKNSRVAKKRYVVDEVATEAGHIVVRLPPYHCQYNPIELVWAQVKSYIAKRNNFKMADLKPLVKEAMRAVTPENWKQAVKHAEQLQEHDTNQDRAVEMYVDSFVIHLSESSDDTSESD
ncbi:uncharacterized protein LOC135095928 [Scylla paramamosain]|uniref:uncharacterized protein LOC135092845 n=1 Tax=Scylla paramamosain TaxID=85552 RepID=UPI003083D212